MKDFLVPENHLSMFSIESLRNCDKPPVIHSEWADIGLTMHRGFPVQFSFLAALDYCVSSFMINPFSFFSISGRVFKEQQSQVKSSLTMRKICKTNRRACRYNLNLKSSDSYHLFVSLNLSPHFCINFRNRFCKFFFIQKVKIRNSFYYFHYPK